MKDMEKETLVGLIAHHKDGKRIFLRVIKMNKAVVR